MAGIPNFLSSLRIGCVPVLLMLAFAGHAQLFLICLAISLATDVLDGLIARRFNAATELGAKLDSWADLATGLALPFCAWWLRPDAIRAEAGYLVVALPSYLGAVVIGFVKYHRLTSYHTWLSKVMAAGMAVGLLVFFAGGPGWYLRPFALLLMLSCAEEIVITLLLPGWRANVPTLWHALRLKRDAAAVNPADAGR